MPNIADLLAGIDAVKRKGANTFRDLLVDPRAAVERILANMAEDLQSNVTFDPEGESVVPEVRDPARERNAQKMINLGSLSGAIRAYHGSPHVFDKFDLDHMGTGEGAQAWGPGHYLAESQKTATSYAKALTGVPPDISDPALIYIRQNVPSFFNDFGLTPSSTTVRGLLRKAESERTAGASYGADAASMKTLDEVIDYLHWYTKPGRLYTVDLRWPNAAQEAADPLGKHHLLDLDAPHFAQSVQKQEQLKKFSEYFGVPSNVSNFSSGRQFLLDLQDFIEGSNVMTRPELARELSKYFSGGRYLDQVSRKSGQQAGRKTHNFVVFDDALPSINGYSDIPRD